MRLLRTIKIVISVGSFYLDLRIRRKKIVNYIRNLKKHKLIRLSFT
jgi:hypothetical protein